MSLFLYLLLSVAVRDNKLFLSTRVNSCAFSATPGPVPCKSQVSFYDNEIRTTLTKSNMLKNIILLSKKSFLIICFIYEIYNLKIIQRLSNLSVRNKLNLTLLLCIKIHIYQEFGCICLT